MPVFSYTALDPTSRRVRGVVRADSPRHARATLLRQGMRPMALAAGAAEPVSTRQSFGHAAMRRVTALRQREQVIDAFENLLTLLESHVPLEEAWQSLMAGHQGKPHKSRRPEVLEQLHEGVRLGKPMGSIMEQFPQQFDAADVALIQAGEASGELTSALARFVVRRQMGSKLLSTLLGALAYPAFLMVFGSAVVVFLTTKVLPSLNAMLVAAGGQIPWPTQVLVLAGRAITHGVLPGLGLLFLGVVVLQRNNATLRKRFINIALRVPVVGQAWHHWQLAQFCLVLRTLVASGVHLPVALVLAGRTTGEGPVAEAASRLRDTLMEGHDLAAPSSDDIPRPSRGVDPGTPTTPHQGQGNGGFPPWLWRALAVGQATGDLVPVLERVGQRFEWAATRSAARLAAVLEPAMILAIGLVVGLIAYGAMLPIIRLGGVW